MNELDFIPKTPSEEGKPEAENSSAATETQLEASPEVIEELREQIVGIETRLNTEFWDYDLHTASKLSLRDTIGNIFGNRTNSNNEAWDKFRTPRVQLAMSLRDQVLDLNHQVDAMIDNFYEANPELTEERLKEMMRGSFTVRRLAAIQNENLEWSGSNNIRPTTFPLLNNSEFQTLISKYNKHQGYIPSPDQYDDEPRPIHYFVEDYLAELTKEHAGEISTYNTLTREEQWQYQDQQTVKEKMSYQDADLPPEQLETMLKDAEGRERSTDYAHYLNWLPEQEVEYLLIRIKSQTKKILDTLGIPQSPYGKSDSWVYWDLGKQQYYYEQNKDKEPAESDSYTYAPALEKSEEISDRHIGWEFYHAPQEIREQALAAIDDPLYLKRVYEILNSDPKADGQLPSHKYTRLGKFLRMYVISKYD